MSKYAYLASLVSKSTLESELRMHSQATNMVIRDHHISPYNKIIAICFITVVETAMRSNNIQVCLINVTSFEVNYYKVRGECPVKPQIW